MFAAVNTWEIYWGNRKGSGGSDKFLNRVSMLYRPFFGLRERNFQIWELGYARVTSAALFAEESKIELWYPVKKRPFECIVARSSFLPIIFYYFNRLEEWGLRLQMCTVCGTGFLATSKHFELCSDDCRKVSAVRAKKRHNKQIDGDKIEMLYESHYQYWYNRLRKLKRNNAPDDELATFTEAFNKFKKVLLSVKPKLKIAGTS